ncbi:MAG: hypothetical protein ACREV7_02790 [Steroidobacteraceae bacterium]
MAMDYIEAMGIREHRLDEKRMQREGRSRLALESHGTLAEPAAEPWRNALVKRRNLSDAQG